MERVLSRVPVNNNAGGASNILWLADRSPVPDITLQIPFTSLQFPLYELLKLQLSRKLHRKPLYAHEAAICGSIAGGTAAAITTPLDVLKTRVMLDLRVSNTSHAIAVPVLMVISGYLQGKNAIPRESNEGHLCIRRYGSTVRGRRPTDTVDISGWCSFPRRIRVGCTWTDDLRSCVLLLFIYYSYYPRTFRI